jgi:serine protease Do
MLGGSLSTYYLLRSPKAAKLLGNNQAGLNQKVSLSEDSAIIDVVKKASPAVVSVVISKDLNKIPGYGLDPNQTDPFYFFFNGRQPQAAPSAPNVQEVGAGSGFFVSADGLILTNKHVVSDTAASYTVLTADGKSYDAKVLSQDPVNDLAIIKIDIKNAPFLSLADSSQIQIGQRVIAIGNSLGQYQNTVTSGIVSGTSRSITAGGNDGSEQLSGVIQTDAAINPGNSGGPLLNISGQVIGINTAIDQQGQLVGFAIPSNDISRALASFQKNGRITRAFLGVRYVLINQSLADQQKLPRNYGALIVRGQTVTDLAVVPGSPADKAGLVENDIILEVNGTKVDDSNSLSALLQNYNIGDVITLKVYDKGNEKDIKVTLGETK